MARENVTLAILFADVASSTRLYEILGNKIAQNLIGDCLSLLSKVTMDHGGTVIKTIGDEIMCTFPTANDAVEAAADMNMSIVEMPIDSQSGTFPPNIYIGIQLGPVIIEDKDVFGDAVNVAAYMVEQAKQRQIITTEETVKALNQENMDAARHIDKITIKGKTGETDIYEIMWEQKDATVMIDVTLDSMKSESLLELHVGDQTINVGKERSIVTLGRQHHNDLVINDIRVSRTHARIEYRRGKFILIDQSTNGTYTQLKGKKSIKLKRDEVRLTGEGTISLGQKISNISSDKLQIQYRLKQSFI